MSRQALSLEQTDPARAAHIWQSCLELLPSDSQQFLAIYQRVAALTGQQGLVPGSAAGNQQTLQYRPGASDHKNDPWPVAIAKTVGSMAVSILVYGAWSHSSGGTWSQSLWFAFGFVVLMLVHEMGHVFATWYYGLSASPPIFIPFIGALINLRQSPPNAKVEAIVGIGGPLLGTIGALACYVAYLAVPGWRTEVLKDVTLLGFFLNFFNLLPVPPLD
ncbi:MAG TPA: site-2 protease family protein, partial [Tepidisphaeraceae bacterium]|nr:site-2 protease family protein [Tepidisphaeraceae bacterium]